MLMMFSSEMVFNKSYSALSVTKAELSQILITNLGLKETVVKKLVQCPRDSRLYRVPKYNIVRSCRTLKKLDVDLSSTTAIMSCMYYQPHTIEHRFHLLQEMGIKNINACSIHSLGLIALDFWPPTKKNCKLSPKIDMINSMFNSIGGSKHDISDILSESSKLPMKKIYEKCFMHYLMYDLNLPSEIFLRTSPRYLSFRLYKEMLHILLNEIKIDLEFILKRPNLLAMSPINVREIITEFKDTKIAGKEFREIIYKFPLVLTCDAKNMKEVVATCKKYDVTDTSLFIHRKILTMENDVLIERFNVVKNHPFLSIWIKHHLILKFIMQFHLYIKRMEYVESINLLKFASIRSIIYSKQRFIRFIKTEIDGKLVSQDVDFFIRVQFGEDKLHLKAKLKRHPHWRTISFDNANAVIQYLKKHCCITDICANIHIMLYSKSAVTATLDKVHKEYSLEKGYFFTPSQYLALCLYMLEKDNHFSGDGIWTEIANAESSTVRTFQSMN